MRLVREPIPTIRDEMPAAALDFHGSHPSLKGAGYTNSQKPAYPPHASEEVAAHAAGVLQTEELPTVKDRALHQVYSLPCSTCGAQVLPHVVREITRT